MEIGEGKAQHYNKQVDMGRILLKGEPGLVHLAGHRVLLLSQKIEFLAL